MYPSAERILESNKAGTECLLAIADIEVAVFERYAALMFNAVKSVVEDCLKQTKARLGAWDRTEPVDLSSAACERSLEEALAYWRSMYDVALQAHGDVTRVMEAQVADWNRRIAEDLGKASIDPATPSGMAAAAVKSALAVAGSTYESLNRISTQTSRLTEAGFNAAMQGARGAGKKKRRSSSASAFESSTIRESEPQERS